MPHSWTAAARLRLAGGRTPSSIAPRREPRAQRASGGPLGSVADCAVARLPTDSQRVCLIRSCFVSTDEEALKRRYREFLDLLPLTVAIAGLPTSDSTRSYTREQMEARAHVLANAFKLARQTAREALRG